MSAKNLQDFLQKLPETAFVRGEGDVYHWDIQKGKGALRQELPWQILNWEISAENEELRQIAFAAHLNAEQFVQNLEDDLKTTFPTFRKASLEADQKSGFWLLVEFLDSGLDADQSRLIENDENFASELPHGLAAVHLSVIHAVGQISVFMTKHCFLGNTPGPFFIELPKNLNRALFGAALSDKTNFNSYLLTLRSEELRSALIDFTRISLSELNIVNEEADLAFGQVKLNFEKKNWKLTWDLGEETPELLVPPMEILEQKEVARRFQRLDELILLEDYQAALQQCREYLEKNPTSLYLVRRWAFLSLWADLPFDQKYLDLMLKFDPQNLMTLSLWTRQSLVQGNSEGLLESLSKLGTSLGQSVVDFETLDITSLTLPEMLGDAWNEKEFKRSVSSYERVLHARGEIPRILVKLIRLMRDIEDAEAEEAYMDRLLACEVPTRTKAAIYYRLAEIKQKVDIKEASQWALKSWHTHRMQVRYAMLAADLLLKLERPNDAVHVLLETSELLEGKEVEHHLELELKIAGVWLDVMQRLDLASERIMRALELVGQDADAFDDLLGIVRKFNDPGLMMEVTLKALELAGSSGDQERARDYAQELLRLIDEVGEGPNAKNVYKNILLTTLVSPEDLRIVLAREDFDLPFQEIAESVLSRLEGMSGKESAPYHLALGEVAQDRAEDSELVYSYYSKALEQGITSPRSSDFLDSYYSRMGMNNERFLLLQKKLDTAQGSERAVILRELYYYDEGVTDAEKDAYALQILKEDNDDVGPLEERLHHYESEGKVESIAALMNELSRLGFERSVLLNLIKAGVQSIESLGGYDRFTFIIPLLSKLKDAGEDPLEIARLSIKHLWDAPDKNYVRSSLALLIQEQQIPEIPVGDLLAILDDDSLKVDLLLALANRSSDFEEILAHERSALRIARENTSLAIIKLEIEKRLATKIEFTLPELSQFIAQSRSAGREADIMPALQSQLKVSVHLDHRDFVLNQFEEKVRSLVDGESSEAVGLLKLIYELTLDDAGRIGLVWFERFGANETLHDGRFLQYVLSDSELWPARGIVLALMEFRLTQPQDLDDTKEMINQFLIRLMTEHREETFHYFVDEPAIFDILTPATLRTGIDFSILQKDQVTFEHFWTRYLSQVESSADALEFLRNSRRYFADFENSKGLFERLEQMVDMVDPGLQPNTFFEARLYLADHLAEFNHSQLKVRHLLEGLHAERPDDSRVWAAMISIYRELKADGELYELLQKVLPSLQNNPKALKEYQISITGLELEFDDLDSKMKQRREQSSSIFSLNEENESPILQVENEESLPHEGFSSKVKTEVSSIQEFGEFAREEVAAVPQFGFTLETGVYEPDQGEEAPSRPLHTSVAPLPGGDGAEFSLDSTQTKARPKELMSDSVSLYENTNIFNPVPDLSSPPPPPKPAPISELASGVPSPFMPAVHESNFDSQPKTPAASLEISLTRTNLGEAWRTVAKTAKADVGLLKDLLARPLDENCEQIIAVQVAALVEDKVGMLENFPVRPWRDPNSLNFELKWTGRMTREQFHPGVKAPLVRLLKSLYPMFIQTFSHEMGLVGVADRLKMRPDEILKIRKIIDFNDEVIQRSTLKYYVAAFQESGYNLYHLPSIGDRFQFDFEKRDIYIDRNHYMAAPPTHIFHRLAFLLRAVSLDYFPFLHLSSSGEIYPFLMKVKRSLDQNDGMKRLLGQDKDPVKSMLSQMKDKEHIALLFQEAGTLSADRISQSVSHLIEQIYRLNLAETLDLIGLIETISGVDLLNPRASAFQRINQSSSAKSIIAFAADLKFSKD